MPWEPICKNRNKFYWIYGIHWFVRGEREAFIRDIFASKAKRWVLWLSYAYLRCLGRPKYTGFLCSCAELCVCGMDNLCVVSRILACGCPSSSTPLPVNSSCYVVLSKMAPVEHPLCNSTLFQEGKRDGGLFSSEGPFSFLLSAHLSPSLVLHAYPINLKLPRPVTNPHQNEFACFS